MNDDESFFYTVKEFAKMMKMSDQIVRKMIRAGEIKGMRFGTDSRAKYRIPRSELLRFQAKAYGNEC